MKNYKKGSYGRYFYQINFKDAYYWPISDLTKKKTICWHPDAKNIDQAEAYLKEYLGRLLSQEVREGKKHLQKFGFITSRNIITYTFDFKLSYKSGDLDNEIARNLEKIMWECGCNSFPLLNRFNEYDDRCMQFRVLDKIDFTENVLKKDWKRILNK